MKNGHRIKGLIGERERHPEEKMATMEALFCAKMQNVLSEHNPAVCWNEEVKRNMSSSRKVQREKNRQIMTREKGQK